MGFLFGGGNKQESAPAPEPAPAPVVSQDGPKEDPKKARRGASSTMLTGSSSLQAAAPTQSKTLLGS
jgi:hypothetical protein